MKTIILILWVSVLASCTIRRNTYIAPMPNVPVFEKAGEFKTNGAASFTHIELQEAYSVTNHIGITAGLFYGAQRRVSYEAGVQYYSRPHDAIRWFIGAGAGKSSVNSRYWAGFLEDADFKINESYQTWFIHPGIYKKLFLGNGTAVNIAFSAKYSYNVLHHFAFTATLDDRKYFPDEKTTITAPKQVFHTLQSLVQLEMARNSITYGVQLGYTLNSSLKAVKEKNVTGQPAVISQVNHQLYFMPVILNCYIGISI